MAENPELQQILRKYDLKRESLIPVLQDIQADLHYLPEAYLKDVSLKLNIPLHEVFSVATFYNAFSLKPKGKYIIQVCMGTACHVRGAPRIVEEIERLLEVERGGTTADKKFSLETVNCVGACALGPVMSINGEYHGNMKPTQVAGVIDSYAKKER